MLKYHIQTIELSSTQSSISFTNIPQDYTDLYITASLRLTTGTTGTYISFNGLTSNFSGRYLYTNVSNGVSAGALARYVGSVSGDYTANIFNNTLIYVSNYSSSINKYFLVDNAMENNATTADLNLISGVWANNAPITSLTIAPDVHSLVAGSTISLYGVRRGSDGIVNAQPAYGGEITYSGGYTIHTFNSSGTFTTTRPLECEYLVIAGGGAGGVVNYGANATSGGGGAGGYRTSVVGAQSGGGASAEARLNLPAFGNYAVVVGAGAAGATNVSVNGPSGTSSSFAGISTVGGGGGSSGESGAGGANGGSGGGGAFRYGIVGGGAGTSGQGFAGGTPNSNINTGGGGGGAGAAGVSQFVGNTPPIGGAGLANSITGSSIVRANGGRGSFEGNASLIDGPAGTGSGGAGYSTSLSPNRGGNGGSGVVIIRYLTP